jgi:hypothetical protein
VEQICKMKILLKLLSTENLLWYYYIVNCVAYNNVYYAHVLGHIIQSVCFTYCIPIV